MSEALIVIDVQNEYFSGLRPVTYPAGSLEKLLRAMDAAHDAQLPVVLIQHIAPDPNSPVFRKGSTGWELVADVNSRPHDAVLEKHLPGSFTGTKLESWLRSRNIDALTICGYMTHMCCDTTARQACHLGFRVNFLSDATGTLAISNSAGNISAEDVHRVILAVQHSRFSRVLSTSEWIAEINASSPNLA